MNRATIQTISEIVLLVSFFTIICAPPLKCVLLPDKRWSDTEKRMLVSFPEIPHDLNTLSQFLKKFEDYYNDHFGFREKLIYRYNREMEKRFGQSGVSDVMTGKAGWYFYAQDEVVNDFRGLTPLTEQQLVSWKTDLVRKKDWLAKRGIHYLFVVAPSKPTIYPEYLPDAFQKAKGVTHLEQLTDYLDKDPDVNILNPTPELYMAKTKRLLYQKTDTHWNRYGAFIAYQKIMHQIISQWFPEEKFKYDFYFLDTIEERPGADLVTMLGLQETLKKEDPILKDRDYCAQPMELRVQIEDFYKLKDTKPFMKGCKDANLRAVVFRDSFFSKIEPYFSENFKEVIYIWQYYDQKTTENILEHFAPDLVVEERTERFCFPPGLKGNDDTEKAK